jgi:hypothetical protein
MHFQRFNRPKTMSHVFLASILIYFSVSQSGYQVAAVQTADSPEFMLRLNFGLALMKRHKVCAVEGYVIHNYHMRLPEPRPREIDKSPAELSAAQTCAANVNCTRMYALARAVASMSNNMRQVVVNLLNKTKELIPSLEMTTLLSRQRRPKAAIGILGDFLHWLAGVSTENDIQEIHHVMDKIKKGTELVASELVRTKQGFLTASTLMNDRLQKMHTVLDDEMKQLHTIHQQVRAQHATASIEMNAITFMADEISRFVQVYSDLFNLELAVESLAHQTLSPSLIAPSQIKSLLQTIARSFEGTQRRLCLNAPHQIYALKDFQVIRQERNVLIRIRLPYSTTQPLTVYETKIFESPVVGKQSFKTQLQQLPRFIVVNLAHDLLAAVDHDSPSELISFDQLKWQTSDSCLSALVFDKPQNVPDVCEFSMKQAPIQPSVYRLAAEKYVVSNFSTIETHCGEDETIRNYHPNCSLCLLNLPCGCALYYDGRKAAVEPHGCTNETTTSSVLYPVNLAILTAFYNITDQNIEGKHLMSFDELQTPQDIEWKIFAEKANKTLAADQELGYSLQKLIRVTQNESDAHIFHSPAEAVLSDIWDGINSRTVTYSFDPFDWKSYITYLPDFLFIPLAIATYRLYNRVNALAIIIAASRAAPVAISYQLKVNPSTTTIAPNAMSDTANSTIALMWQQIVREVRTTDAFFAISTIIGIVLTSTATLLIAIRQTTARSSYIYLDALSTAGCVQIRLLRLPHARRTFTVKQTQTAVRIQTRSYGIFGILRIAEGGIIIKDAATSANIAAPTWIFVSAKKAKQLALIMTEANVQMTILAVHTHEVVTCMTLSLQNAA